MRLTSLSFAYPQVAAGDRARILEPSLTVQGAEVFFLATCLRVEIAWCGDADLAPVILEGMYGEIPLPPVMVRTDLEAFHHMCGVAAGLKSAQVGETEVLSQFRRAAWHLGARKRGESELVRIVETAIAVARAARRSLSFEADGSLALAASRMVDHLPEVVVLGSGAMARAVVRALGRSRAVVYARGSQPVAGVVVRPWEDLPDVLATCHGVVSTIPGPVDILSRVERQEIDPPLLFVDLGMPPAVSTTDPTGLVIHRGIDTVASSMLTYPTPDVEDEVADESARAWNRLSVPGEAASIITSLIDKADLIVDEEVRRFAHRLPAGSDAEEVLQQLAHTVARRIIHPSLSLLSSTPLGPDQLDMVARAFGVERE